MAKEKERRRLMTPKRSERSPSGDYTADWQRESKAQIVENAISALREDIKRVISKRPKAA